MTATYDIAVRNMFLYSELLCALRTLRAADVSVIVLKGAALADTIYPSIASRPMNDIDLLVHRADRERARAALESAGFCAPYGIRASHEMHLRRGERPIVELHWDLASIVPLRLAALDNEALWQEARPFTIGSVQVHQLSIRDTLLHLCLHLSGHGYLHDNSSQDIRRLLTVEHPFPWDQFVQRARQFRLTATCYFVLDAMASRRDIVVPPEVLDALRPPRWQRQLVHSIADPLHGLAGKMLYNKARNYLLYLALADRPMKIPLVTMQLLFPGPRWLAERYRLQGGLQPYLACIWHPGVLLAEGAAALWTLAVRR